MRFLTLVLIGGTPLHRTLYLDEARWQGNREDLDLDRAVKGSADSTRSPDLRVLKFLAPYVWQVRRGGFTLFEGSRPLHRRAQPPREDSLSKPLSARSPHPGFQSWSPRHTVDHGGRTPFARETGFPIHRLIIVNGFPALLDAEVLEILRRYMRDVVWI